METVRASAAGAAEYGADLGRNSGSPHQITPTPTPKCARYSHHVAGLALVLCSTYTMLATMPTGTAAAQRPGGCQHWLGWFTAPTYAVLTGTPRRRAGHQP